MAKPCTFPTLFDEARQINISDLKKWGYLEPNQSKQGTITWKTNGSPTGSISMLVSTYTKPGYMTLTYSYAGEPERHFKVKLITLPSNLGKGVVWYFLCPSTHKRCRKLFMIDGYFLHREAFKGAMYESQTHSKKYRELDKTMGAYLRRDWYYPELYKKHSKKTYAGKPTKRYLRLMKLIEQGNRHSR